SNTLPAFPVLGTIDLVLCRNVLIYFDEAAVRRAATLLYGALREGGYLLTSPSDPPMWDLAPFATEMTPAGIVYRRLDAAQHRAPAPGPAAAAAPVAATSRAARAAPRRDRTQRRPLQLAGEEATALQRAEAAFAAGAWRDAARLSAGLDD